MLRVGAPISLNMNQLLVMHLRIDTILNINWGKGKAFQN